MEGGKEGGQGLSTKGLLPLRQLSFGADVADDARSTRGSRGYAVGYVERVVEPTRPREPWG